METAISAFFLAAALYILVGLAITGIVIYFIVKFFRKAGGPAGSRSRNRDGLFDAFDDGPSFGGGRSGGGGDGGDGDGGD